LPSLAAALALLVFKAMHREYVYVASLAHSCSADSHLTPEEQQLWEQLEHLAGDTHPDAVGCRLHLSHKTVASGLQLPWNVDAELRLYCRLLPKISAACRLQLDDEMQLLQEFGMATRQLRNRKSILELNLLADPAGGRVVQLTMEQPPAARRGARCFDAVQDQTCVGESGESLRALGSGVALGTYKPPESGYGSKTVRVLHALLDSLSLSGSSAERAGAALGVAARPLPGFVLCLELLSKKLDLRVLQGDNPAYVCVCVCVCVCILCEYVSVCVSLCLCVYVSMCRCMYV
jgi:hypothetical protein